MTSKMDIIEFFDYVYGRYERYWWREDTRYSTRPEDHPVVPAKLLEVLAARPPGRALDLGAGEGADAIRLARLGYEVDAVEGSSVGAEKIQVFAREAGVKVNVINADAREVQLNQRYDVIICNGLLHYLEDKASMLQKMKQLTRVGGIHMTSVFTAYTPIPDVHQITHVYCDAEDGVVSTFYRDFKLHLFLLERDKLDVKHPDFPPHRHSMLKIIAEKQKP